MQKSYASHTAKEMAQRQIVLNNLPPDWKITTEHRKAQYALKIPNDYKPTPQQSCKCCGEPHDLPKYSVCSDSHGMGIYGFGLPLYFVFESNLCKLFGILLAPGLLTLAGFILSGMFLDNIVWNKLNFSSSSGSFYTWWSFSYCNYELYGPMMMGSCILYCLFYYFGSLYVARNINNESDKLNANILDPTDYSIMISNLPTVGLNEEDFIDRFCSYIGISRSAIARYVYTNNISKYVFASNKLISLTKTKTLIDKYRNALMSAGMAQEIAINKYPESIMKCTRKFKDYDDLLAKISYAEQEIEELQKNPDSHLKNAPILFITFKNISIKNSIIAKYKSKYNSSTSIPSTNEDVKIKIHNAQEPTSILWENLHVSSQVTRSIFTWFITSLIIAGSFAGNYFLKKNGDMYAQQIAQSGDTQDIKVKTFSILSSVFVTIINVVVVFIMPILTKLEQHITITDYQSSTSFKLALAQFINTALIPLVLNWDASTYFNTNGLLDQVIFNWVFLMFSSPLIEIFDVPNLLSHISMCCAKSKGSKSELLQLEANKIFTPPPQPMHLKYSNMLLIVYYSAFYLQLWPPGIGLFLVGMLFNYLSDKILTICRYSRHDVPSEDIAIFTANTLVGGTFLIAASNFIFLYQTHDSLPQKLIYGIVPIVLAIGLLVASVEIAGNKTPNKHCLRFYSCFLKNGYKFNIEEESNEEYDIGKFGDEDYMALNPITRKQALLQNIDHQIKLKPAQNSEMLIQQREQIVNYCQPFFIQPVVYTNVQYHDYQLDSITNTDNSMVAMNNNYSNVVYPIPEQPLPDLYMYR